MTKLKPHRNLVRLIGMVTYQQKLCFIVEFCERGDVRRLVQKGDPLVDIGRFAAIARDILTGLVALHDERMIHRDIACRNLLMKADGTVSWPHRAYVTNYTIPFLPDFDCRLWPDTNVRRQQGILQKERIKVCMAMDSS
mmetsp:Transcript_10899/g.21386  ORF Transcript_10899/g.21386 Transcript_10899/m.21386 type:complete len:139 (+) Transcript_10899:971-1387(+)